MSICFGTLVRYYYCPPLFIVRNGNYFFNNMQLEKNYHKVMQQAPMNGRSCYMTIQSFLIIVPCTNKSAESAVVSDSSSSGLLSHPHLHLPLIYILFSQGPSHYIHYPFISSPPKPIMYETLSSLSQYDDSPLLSNQLCMKPCHPFFSMTILPSPSPHLLYLTQYDDYPLPKPFMCMKPCIPFLSMTNVKMFVPMIPFTKYDVPEKRSLFL